MRDSLMALSRRSTAFLPAMGLIVVVIGMMFLNSRFLSLGNLENIGRQVSINAIISVGMTFAILTGGIDLSVGATMALTGTLTAGLLASGVSGVVAIVAGIGAGMVFGLGNGLCIAGLRMPPIIVTLASMSIARGLGLIYTNGYPVTGLPDWFGFLGRGTILGVQTPIVIMALTFVVAYVMLEKMPIGRYIFAIGGNEDAVRLSGIDARRYKVIVYLVSGVTAAIAGILLSSRLMSGQPNAGMGFELDAIAAVVLGGTAISGGRGSIIGTLIGALLLGVLNNGLNLMNISPYVQNVIKGAIILLAIFISRQTRPGAR
ncbi:MULTISPECIES: ABC transporter permease [Asaia]|uniref:Ribose/xylose/arabinose/galactoside ABC transporter permease n=1 Tax=Asaia krungthepensis NRIC 0535 TaxID=1307925 RepID=A0ABQ0Q6S3_9PROT|nr:ribose ABC transporter permease [Asaia krungthepensis]GBQ93913.1 ribose/xylose/arabinose/galactoside ABC transporter permease [Asaia krungthepensis NRIC 0535]